MAGELQEAFEILGELLMRTSGLDDEARARVQLAQDRIKVLLDGKSRPHVGTIKKYRR